MAELVTLEQAKGHAKLKGSDHQDGELQDILNSSHAVFLEQAKQRINSNADGWHDKVDSWTEGTAPEAAKQGIRLLFTFWERYRGDDEHGAIPQFERGRLPMQVEACLNRLKDPTLA